MSNDDDEYGSEESYYTEEGDARSPSRESEQSESLEDNKDSFKKQRKHMSRIAFPPLSQKDQAGKVNRHVPISNEYSQDQQIETERELLIKSKR